MSFFRNPKVPLVRLFLVHVPLSPSSKGNFSTFLVLEPYDILSVLPRFSFETREEFFSQLFSFPPLSYFFSSNPLVLPMIQACFALLRKER